MKRTLFVLGLSTMLAMPVWAAGTSGSAGSGGSSMGTGMEQQREQSGQQGMSQGQIRQAQQSLKEAGFDPGPIDGQFGPKTQEALRAFQRSHGLPQTGQLDETTRESLMAQQGRESPGGSMAPGRRSDEPGMGTGSSGMGSSSPGGSGTGGSGPGR